MFATLLASTKAHVTCCTLMRLSHFSSVSHHIRHKEGLVFRDVFTAGMVCKQRCADGQLKWACRTRPPQGANLAPWSDVHGHGLAGMWSSAAVLSWVTSMTKDWELSQATPRVLGTTAKDELVPKVKIALSHPELNVQLFRALFFEKQRGFRFGWVFNGWLKMSQSNVLSQKCSAPLEEWSARKLALVFPNRILSPPFAKLCST